MALVAVDRVRNSPLQHPQTRWRYHPSHSSHTRYWLLLPQNARKRRRHSDASSSGVAAVEEIDWSRRWARCWSRWPTAAPRHLRHRRLTRGEETAAAVEMAGAGVSEAFPVSPVTILPNCRSGLVFGRVVEAVVERARRGGRKLPESSEMNLLAQLVQAVVTAVVASWHQHRNPPHSGDGECRDGDDGDRERGGGRGEGGGDDGGGGGERRMVDSCNQSTWLVLLHSGQEERCWDLLYRC